MGGEWLQKDLSWSLRISESEVSGSLNRSMISGLISPDKKKVMKSAFLKFIEFGVRYVFPAVPGKIARGVATAHSAPILKDHFISEEIYVWPSKSGRSKGQSVAPLSLYQVDAATEDAKLYDMLALLDAIRLGKPRECQKSIELLTILFDTNA